MKLNEKNLAQYYDGELSENDAAAIKMQLENSPQSTESLKQMEAVSDCIKMMTEENLDKVSFEGFDKRILNDIHSQKAPPSLGERLQVWFSEFFEHRKVVWIPTASVAGAACAALLAVNLNSNATLTPNMPSSSGPDSWQASANEQTTDVSLVTVANADSVDAQAYNIESDNGQRVGVVWIND